MAGQIDPLVLLTFALDHDGHSVIVGRRFALVDEAGPQTHRLAAAIFAAIGRELDGMVLAQQLRCG